MTRRWIWASLAIASMWIAVLFVSLFAPSLQSHDVAGNDTTLPLAGIVTATFAFVATIVVAVVGFRESGTDLERERLERMRLEARIAELETARIAEDERAPTRGRTLLHR